MDKRRILNFLLITVRLLIGSVFIFSGFVKGIDPLGTAYKINDYLIVFGIDFPIQVPLTISILLNASEFILGIAIVLGLFTYFFTRMALLFMAFSTPLTLYLAIYNPVTDCGCFGDAIVLSNWETFYKNVILSVLVVFLLIFNKEIQSAFSIQKQWLLLVTSSFSFFLVTFISYQHLPLIDFRPYKTGTNIPQGMVIPEGAPLDSFQTILVYQNGTTIKEFTPKTIPWQDTTWKWVETNSKLIKEGYHPPIYDFAFIDMEGNDLTDDMIGGSSFTFLAISHKLDKVNKNGMMKLNDIYILCESAPDCNFYFATASNESVISYISRNLNFPFEFCTADEIMLKTIIRSNPGLVLIKNGTILGKWHYNDIPEFNENNFNIYASVISSYRAKMEYTTSVIYFGALTSLALMIIYYGKNGKDATTN